MRRRLSLGLLGVVLTAATAAAQTGGTESYLNQLDLNFAQYGERMGLSLWAFNQNMAQAGMGDRREVINKGEARIRAGKANVGYRPLAPTLAEAFAASRSTDAAKRRELVGVYNENLKRFRD